LHGQLVYRDRLDGRGALVRRKHQKVQRGKIHRRHQAVRADSGDVFREAQTRQDGDIGIVPGVCVRRDENGSPGFSCLRGRAAA